MPFGLGTKTSKFSKKKTYSVQDHHVSTLRSGGGGGERTALPHQSKSTGTLGSRGRRNTLPSGILKRGGRSAISFPALEDGMVPQEMAAAIPMPTEAELNALFAEMVVCY